MHTALLFAVLTPFAAAEEKGWFGYTLNVGIEGIFEQTVTEIEIKSVAGESPAAAKGIKPGDFIIEVEGTQVAGAKASKLKTLMTRAVGELLRLRLKRPRGEAYDVALVAVRKPG